MLMAEVWLDRSDKETRSSDLGTYSAEVVVVSPVSRLKHVFAGRDSNHQIFQAPSPCCLLRSRPIFVFVGLRCCKSGGLRCALVVRGGDEA